MQTVTQIIEEVVETICNKHCKYPELYFEKYDTDEEAEEHLYSEMCDNCILNKL